MSKQKPLQSGTIQENKQLVTSGLDWLSVTYKNCPDDYWKTLPEDGANRVEYSPKNGYTIGYKCRSGATISWNDDRPQMGTHVVYSASAIQKASEEFGYTQEQILHYLTEFAHIARIDLRIDALNYDINIHDMYMQAINGKVETRAKTTGFIDSGAVGSKEAGASTCYIGSQKNRTKLLRVYDKGMQNGSKLDLKRFEIEFRGETAQNAGNSLKRAKYEDYGETIAGMIRGFADWKEYEQFQEIFGLSQKIPVTVPQAGETNTVRWLLETIAPILAKEIYRDLTLADKFGNAVQSVFDELSSN